MRDFMDVAEDMARVALPKMSGDGKWMVEQFIDTADPYLAADLILHAAVDGDVVIPSTLLREVADEYRANPSPPDDPLAEYAEAALKTLLPAAA